MFNDISNDIFKKKKKINIRNENEKYSRKYFP